MNVTLKLDDSLCRAARHRAVDRGISLSAWVAELVSREVRGGVNPADGRTLLDRLAMSGFEDRDFTPERDPSPGRDMNFG